MRIVKCVSPPLYFTSMCTKILLKESQGKIYRQTDNGFLTTISKWNLKSVRFSSMRMFL